MDETSQPIDLLLSVTRQSSRTLEAQIEDQLRHAIRQGTLKAGTRVPSTRDLARQLGVSRRVVVGAYEQLAAEGYLTLRQGARPKVSEAAVAGGATSPRPARPGPLPRFDFRPRAPDVSSFPRTAWLRSLREALATLTLAHPADEHDPPIGVSIRPLGAGQVPRCHHPPDGAGPWGHDGAPRYSPRGPSCVGSLRLSLSVVLGLELGAADPHRIGPQATCLADTRVEPLG